MEVSDDVGDLLPGGLVDGTGERVDQGGSDKDIGKGDSLADKECSVEEDLVEDLEFADQDLEESVEGLLGLRNALAHEVEMRSLAWSMEPCPSAWSGERSA